TAVTAATSAARARRRTAACYRRSEAPRIALDHGRFAEQRLYLGVEVCDRRDAVVRPELEGLRPGRRLQREHDLRLSGELADDVAELAERPGAGLARVDLQRDRARRDVRLELGDLDRDQLRLPFLVVDAALEDEDAVGLAELPRGRVDGVEDDRLRAAREVVEPEEDHRVALLGRQRLHRRDDPADRDDLAVPAALELRQRPVGLAAQLLGDPGERVLADPEAERLLLQPQELALLVLLRGDRRVVLRPFHVRLQQVEDRSLAALARVELAPAEGERLVEHRAHPLARGA